MNERDQEILDLLFNGWSTTFVEEFLELSPGVVLERLSAVARERGLYDPDSLFRPVSRLIYLEAKRRGLLKGWP